MHTKIAFAIIVIISLSLAFSAREITPSFQKCEREYQAQGASQQKEENSALSFERVVAFRCTAEFVNRYNAVITAIATVLLTIVTGGLVWTGYQQIKTIRAQLRGYVFPESGGVTEGMMMVPQIPAKANEPGLVLTYRNTGQTPAFKVVSWGQVAVIEPINEEKLIVPTLEKIHLNTLGANGSGNKSLWFGRPLTPGEIADVIAGAKAIYLYGRIEYQDIFGEDRYTNFRFFYSGPFPPAPNVILSVSNKGNDAS